VQWLESSERRFRVLLGHKLLKEVGSDFKTKISIMFLIAFEFIDCTLQLSTRIDVGSGSRPGGGRHGFRSGVSFIGLAVVVVGVVVVVVGVVGVVVVVGVVGVVVNALRVGRETLSKAGCGGKLIKAYRNLIEIDFENLTSYRNLGQISIRDFDTEPSIPEILSKSYRNPQ
jgi:hypothetical protein